MTDLKQKTRRLQCLVGSKSDVKRKRGRIYMNKKTGLAKEQEGGELQPKKNKATLKELLDQASEKSPPKEIDFGRPEGRELL